MALRAHCDHPQYLNVFAQKNGDARRVWICSPRKGAVSEYQRRCEEHQSDSLIAHGTDGRLATAPLAYEPHRSVGVELERGGFNAKKNGDAEAFGFYERTPLLP